MSMKNSDTVGNRSRDLPVCSLVSQALRLRVMTVAYVGIFPGRGVMPRNVSGGGLQQIQLRTEGRENGDLGAVAPQSGVPLKLQMSETRILIRLLRIYFSRNWEFA